MDIDQFQVIVPSSDTIIRAELDRFIIGQGLNRFRSIIETLAMDFARIYILNGDAVACLPLGAIQREVNRRRRCNFGRQRTRDECCCWHHLLGTKTP